MCVFVWQDECEIECTQRMVRDEVCESKVCVMSRVRREDEKANVPLWNMKATATLLYSLSM